MGDHKKEKGRWEGGYTMLSDKIFLKKSKEKGTKQKQKQKKN